jgi:hypothetical protein
VVFYAFPSNSNAIFPDFPRDDSTNIQRKKYRYIANIIDDVHNISCEGWDSIIASSIAYTNVKELHRHYSFNFFFRKFNICFPFQFNVLISGLFPRWFNIKPIFTDKNKLANITDDVLYFGWCGKKWIER